MIVKLVARLLSGSRSSSLRHVTAIRASLVVSARLDAGVAFVAVVDGLVEALRVDVGGKAALLRRRRVQSVHCCVHCRVLLRRMCLHSCKLIFASLLQHRSIARRGISPGNVSIDSTMTSIASTLVSIRNRWSVSCGSRATGANVGRGEHSRIRPVARSCVCARWHFAARARVCHVVGRDAIRTADHVRCWAQQVLRRVIE